MTAHDVFISHSSQDRGVAEAARAAIERAGHRCWIAPRDIVPGEKYGEAIVNGIRASRIFLLVVSARSVASHQVERETERAANAGLAIIPFRIEDVAPSPSLEFFISSAHWLDAFEPPLERHYDYLVEVVGRLLAGADGKPAPQAPAPSPPPAAPSRRIRRRQAIAVAALLAAVAAGGAFWWGWWRQDASGASCVRGDYLTRATTGDERKPLNMRRSPSLEGGIVEVIRPGETFCVASRRGDWWRAQHRNGKEGYVYAPRISLIVQQAPSAGNAVAPPAENKQ